MYEGPILQSNLVQILLSTRAFRYIYSADISKMFRQIFILPEDRDKYRIIWRPTKEEPVREYRLNTVTYGTDAAPFLAIRTIQQCAIDNAPPLIADIIKRAFYMDDLLYGADTIEVAISQIQQIIETLNAGCLPLTKWMSNHPQVLDKIQNNDRITSYLEKDKTDVKLLGVPYNFTSDEFQIKLKEPGTCKPTKRGISSIAASFYDPLGFILPFIMMLRIFMKQIWKLNYDWDDVISEDVYTEFLNNIKGIVMLSEIKIPRFIATNVDNTIELIGFADASSLAQAGVIYGRFKGSSGYKVVLIAAKGNVSKFKTAAILESKQNTIPKLELQALVTLSNLLKIIKDSFSTKTFKITCYTDSQVAKAWVRSTKSIPTKFIEKRVTLIKQHIDPENLHYIPSDQNPADPASRGLTAEKLTNCKL